MVMCMKRIIKFFKEYYIFLLFIIPIMMIIYFNKSPNNDIWFILSCGRYVFANGIPTIEPFTIHEGFNYIMQQWLSASIFWGIFNTFGKFGILTLMYIMSFALMFTFYKLCKLVNGSKNISVIITTITFCCCYNYIMTRPQIFTYLILLLEILLMEKYVKTNNIKFLFVMPLLSLLLINLHSTMWYFQFVFMLPFIVNSFYIKKVSIDKFKMRPLLIAALVMFLVGFINPYGYKSIIFIFNSYGVESINKFIAEMYPSTFEFIKLPLALMLSLFVLIHYTKKRIFDVRHVLFICGTFILLLMHIKCHPYFYFAYFYAVAYGLKNIKFKFNIKFNDCIKTFFNAIKYSFCFMLLLTIFYFTKLAYTYYNFYPFLYFDRDHEVVADFIEENYELDKVRMYVHYSEGGYFIYRGIKVYIDPRAEVFLKSNNGKEDIFDEFIDVVLSSYGYDYEAFVKKYNFTHLLVLENSNLDIYLKNNNDFEKVFVLNYDFDENQPFQNLYVSKDLRQEVSK